MERQDSAPRPSSRKGIKRFSGERLRHAATLGDIGALRAELADKASARNLQKALDEGLKLAAQHGRVEAALYLIDCGADVAIERGAPFAMAIWRGELEVAAALMERGVDVADCGQVHWLLLAAVNQNDLELAQLLLEKGVEPGHPNLLPRCGRP
jgi:hypothetical protein